MVASPPPDKPCEAKPQPGASPGVAQAPAKAEVAPQQAAGEPQSPRGGASALQVSLPTEAGARQAEVLLPLSSDDATPVPSIELLPALPAEEAERRRRRRETWEREVEGRQRWDLQRRLVDISTDVEFLAREVERVRTEMEVPLPSLNDLNEAERTQLEALRRKRCNELLVNHCKKALAHITSHKWSWPFNAPVDLRQYPDYAETVSHPMDFGTIKRRIDGGAYRHPDEFLADVRLVFDNARLYNKPGSDVHVMANTLQERFEERYAASVTPRVLEEAAVTAHQLEEARRRHLEANSRDGGDALEQQCAVLVKYIDEVQACILDAKSAAAALCKPVSREDKEALVRALTSMPQDQFELAVGLVMAHHPGLQPYDDFGFDLDALDALTLRQMQSFVRACEAVEAEAKQRGTRPAPVSWPRLLVGSGLRGYRPVGGNKRQKRQQASSPAQQQQQQEVPVKQEQQQQQQQQGRQQQQSHAASLTSTLTPEEVAAAAAAAGLISPVLPLGASGPAGDVPAAGSAVGPKPLQAAPELPRAQRQQQQAGQKQAASGSKPAASPGMASSAPVAPLAAAQGPQQAAASKAASSGPTAAQLAAVANAGPQQHILLAQMHSLLSQAAAAQKASELAAASKQQQGSKK